MNPGDVIESWTLRERLGRGAQGEVWLSSSPGDAPDVAIKVLDPVTAVADEDWLTRLRSEAQTLARLDHPAIVKLLESDLDHTPPYLVMEWVEGETLRARIKRLGALGVEDALELATQVASALRHLHDHGIAHRDIKPENLLLAHQNSNAVKLVDFGIALQSGAARLTQPGRIWGSLPYLPPEAIESDEPVDGYSQDLYGLGVVLYEALTGKEAFPLGDLPTLDQQRIQIMRRKRNLDALILDPIHFGGPLRGLVRELTARDQTQRPASAAELLERIDQLGAITAATVEQTPDPPHETVDTEELPPLPPAPARPPPLPEKTEPMPVRPPPAPGPPPPVIPPVPRSPPPRVIGASGPPRVAWLGGAAVLGLLLGVALWTAISPSEIEPAPAAEPARADPLAAGQKAPEVLRPQVPPEEPDPEPDPQPKPAPPTSRPSKPALPAAEPLGSVTRTGKAPRTITASTVLQRGCTVDGAKQDCSPAFLSDGRGDTAWCEGVAGTGTGHYLELEFAMSRTLRGLEFDNGYWKDSRTYASNGRVTRVEVATLEGESIGRFDVGGGFGRPATVSFASPVRTSGLLVTIAGAKAGARYDDICISDLRALVGRE